MMIKYIVYLFTDVCVSSMNDLERTKRRRTQEEVEEEKRPLTCALHHRGQQLATTINNVAPQGAWVTLRMYKEHT